MFRLAEIANNPVKLKQFISNIIKPASKKVQLAENYSAQNTKITPKTGDFKQKKSFSPKEKHHYNPNSNAGQFFGLDSYQSMHEANTEGLFTDLKINSLSCKTFITESIHNSFLEGCSNLVNIFKKLHPNCDCARITFSGNCFDGNFHTLGFVRNKDTLYILDSLGNNTNIQPELLEFHQYINFLISANKHNGLKKIIFNHNNQQGLEELTCNHWTFANIESLIKALKSGKSIQTSTALDKVLPKNINKVLEEHMGFVLDFFKS